MSRAMPPLLALAEGRRARPRREAVERPREVVLHRSIVDLLRKVGDPRWLWTHPASGEKRDPRTAAKLKALGVRRGWPDLLFIGPDGRLACLEIKAPGGVLSDDQEDFQIFCVRANVRHAVIRSLDEAVATLTGWGAIVRVKGVSAPPSRPVMEGDVETSPSQSVANGTSKNIETTLPPTGEVRE